jgi:hypothetical protein
MAQRFETRVTYLRYKRRIRKLSVFGTTTYVNPDVHEQRLHVPNMTPSLCLYVPNMTRDYYLHAINMTPYYYLHDHNMTTHYYLHVPIMTTYYYLHVPNMAIFVSTAVKEPLNYLHQDNARIMCC